MNCEECAIDEAQRFFDKPWVRALHEASDECPVGFKILIDGPFRALGEEIPAEVMIQHLDSDVPASHIQVTRQGRARIATMGGVVLVCHRDWSESLYGLIVRYVLTSTEHEDLEADKTWLFCKAPGRNTSAPEPAHNNWFHGPYRNGA